MDGFVGRRNLDPGAFAGANTPIVSVVDIGTVRLVANLVEKDFKRVHPGVEAEVEVDAFPGETFTGQVSRVAPVFDPATRTASMEIEVPEPRLPAQARHVRAGPPDGRAARGALTVPRNAVIDLDGKRGVFIPEGAVARFRVVRTGLQDADRVEILDGIEEGQRIVTTGSLALRDGDRVTVTDAGARPDRAGRGGAGAGRGGGRP